MIILDERTVVNRLRQLGLLENPFLAYTDARYFVPCVEHTSLYQEILQLCVGEPHKRVALIRGGTGTGKSTLTTRLSNTVFPGGVVSLSSVLINEPVPTQTMFVRSVNDSFQPQQDTPEETAGALRARVDQSIVVFAVTDPGREWVIS